MCVCVRRLLLLPFAFFYGRIPARNINQTPVGGNAPHVIRLLPSLNTVRRPPAPLVLPSRWLPLPYFVFVVVAAAKHLSETPIGTWSVLSFSSCHRCQFYLECRKLSKLYTTTVKFLTDYLICLLQLIVNSRHVQQEEEEIGHFAPEKLWASSAYRLW